MFSTLLRGRSLAHLIITRWQDLHLISISIFTQKTEKMFRNKIMEKRIKKTYICRNVTTYNLLTTIEKDYCPKAGDVGIFEVMHIGKHNKVQGESKLNVTIIESDYIMAAFGTRYATAQLEGYIPDHLNQELHILGAGGI
jgi:hypothetical protein